MTFIKLIIRTLRHYPWSGLATAAGIAITTTIICGALIIGDSLRRSLVQIVDLRLGQTTHTLTAGDRIFSGKLAYKILENDGHSVAPVLKTEAIVSVQEREARVNKVQVWGIDSSFARVVGSDSKLFQIAEGEIIISENLSARLKVDTGDFVLLRMRTVSPIPSNTPFVSEAGQTVTRRMKVNRVIRKDESAHFNLQTSQTAPYNIFVNIDWLNQIMELDGLANMILFSLSQKTDDEEIRQMVRRNIDMADLGLELNYRPGNGALKLTADRVFIDEYSSNQIKGFFPQAQSYLTYFANTIRHNDLETPYSFVTAGNQWDYIRNINDMVVNQWLADDLELNEGDSIEMSFFVVGPLRELEEHSDIFRVVKIIPMEKAVMDSILMPHLPGLSDAGSCRDWDTGIPINLDKIRQKDEDYWDQYKGTPKAWISLDKGMHLWQNRFGKFTTIVLPPDQYNFDGMHDQLTGIIDPFRLEFQVNPVREEGLKAASGGVDFGQLFAGLGMFIIISGLLLSALLIQFSLQKRQDQIQLFASLGFSKNLIRKIVFAEAFLIIVIGALAGLALSVGYTRLVFSGLNQLWYDIVRTDVLILHFNGWIMFSGWLASVFLGFITVFLGTRRILNKSLKKEEAPQPGFKKRRKHWLIMVSAIVMTTLFLGLLAVAMFFSASPALFAWLAAGIVLLGTILLWLYYGLQVSLKPGQKPLSITLFGWKNLLRNKTRSFTIATLLALGSFVIVVTAANRKDLAADPGSREGGTGGFVYMAETTVPILRNLNLPDTREELGLPADVNFVQFLTTYDDDASCHNLNRVANPRLMATDMKSLNGRFSVVAAHSMLDKDDPWKSLDQPAVGFIPAIADQSVIQWGLGKKVGDTLFYINSKGEEIRVLLIGGLDNSVLQGNVIISQKHFLENFPATDGSAVFLIEAPGHDPDLLHDELNFVFRDFGWEMVSTTDKLAGFNAVENTYLQIFFLLGALGMLLGTVGLAIIIAKSLLERTEETSMFRALGFKLKTILGIYLTEYVSLFLTGLAAGTLSGIIATMPSWLMDSQNIDPWFLATAMGIIVLNGLFWILMILLTMLKNQKYAV